ncbi:hypothetical protein OH768_07505 [Streptomyces sp. NBC_01622]|uniref:hypothetical protein n=1 Tax=Streptomyces sp. NBC_01622 TaxID=2975903 RepID=UPI00386317F9|nr:hypothetical protein OH768_07505 [Streptomyces sp. NBC_01622]
MVCTPAGLPVTWALADLKIDERHVPASLIDDEPHLAAVRRGLLNLAGKGYIAAELGRFLGARNIQLLRLSYRNCSTPQPVEALLKTVRQRSESVNDTLKGQLDLEQHGDCTIQGVAVCVTQRILVMTCAIWNNRTTGAPLTSSLRSGGR